MPLPVDLTTITLTGTFPDAAGTDLDGSVVVTPTVQVVDSVGNVVITTSPIYRVLSGGTFSITGLACTDNTHLAPAGWAYTVTTRINGITNTNTYFLPSTLGASVDLADLTPATVGPIVTAYAQQNAPNTFTAANTFNAPVSVTDGLTLGTTPIGNPPGGTTEYLRADGTWDVPAGGGGGAVTSVFTRTGAVTAQSGDYSFTEITGTAATTQGGTGATSLAAAGIVVTGNAATTVQAGTAYGAGSAVGTDTTYAREDHQHGTPALTSAAPATTEGIGQSAAVGTATSPARADHVHPLAAAGTPGTSAVGDSATTGTSTAFAASDHKHGREAFAAPAAATTYGLTATTGTATTVAHSDHTHGTPALTVTAPAATLGIGTAAALGVATLPALADHVHPTAAAGTPGASAVGDTTSTGVATTPAASDHRHAREAFAAPTATTTYGLASVTGSATTLAHSDHTHGTPALTTTAPAATLGIGTAAALGVATLPALADHVHPIAGAATPTTSAVGDAAATGNATTFAASNHVHGREAFGAVSALAAFPTSSANGAAATVSRSDHQHGAPALPTATTGAAGIIRLDGTAADIQALGAQAAGASGLAADAQHVHPTTGLTTTVNGAGGAVTAAYPLAAVAKQTSATVTIGANQYVPCDTTSNAITGNLPAAPADRTMVGVKLVVQPGTNTVTIACGGSDVFNKAGGGTTLTLSLLGQGVLLIYAAAGGIWYVVSDDLTLSSLDSRYVLASALPLPVASGGTGQITAQAGMNTLAGGVTAGSYLRGNGTNILLSTIQAADLPTATTSTQGAIQLDGTSTDIQALGTQAAGTSGLAADAKHVHPTTGLAVIDATAGDIQPLGVQAAGSVGKASDAGHVHPTTGVVTTFNPSAARWGLKTETIPFYSGNLAATLTSGTLFLMLIEWPANVQLSKLSVYVTNIGVTLNGVNALGLYSSSGTLITTTGDMTTAFGTAGWQEGTLASPPTPTSDTAYYVGILTHNAGTAPKIWAYNMTLSPGAVNGVFPAIDFATQTSHATFTPSSGTLNSGAYWVGAR